MWFRYCCDVAEKIEREKNYFCIKINIKKIIILKNGDRYKKIFLCLIKPDPTLIIVLQGKLLALLVPINLLVFIKENEILCTD